MYCLDVRDLLMEAVPGGRPVEVTQPAQTWLVAMNVAVRMGTSLRREMRKTRTLLLRDVSVRKFNTTERSFNKLTT